MNEFCIYVTQRDINDATSYYIDVILRAIEKSGNKGRITKELNDIKSNEIVIVVKPSAFMRIKLRNPRQKVIIWFQGIQPEEILLTEKSRVKRFFYNKLLGFFEKIAYKHSILNIYVSEKMQEHFHNKYSCAEKEHFIMPCYNCEYEENVFDNTERYNKPTFVYAGSMDEWQCIEPTFSIFKRIQDLLPESRLTILTKQQEKANMFAQKYDLKNYDIKYVSVENIQNELAKYKYGFILRDNICVNQVATPTKINSYISAGVIPIVSTCIDGFYRIANQLNSIIFIKDIQDKEEISKRICGYEGKSINVNNLREEYQGIFSSYYCTDKYVSTLCDKLNTLTLS